MTERLKYKLFLDDIRKPPEPFFHWHQLKNATIMSDQSPTILTRDIEEFKDCLLTMLKRGRIPESVSFDHDLSPTHYIGANSNNNNAYDVFNDTGNDCAMFFIKFLDDYELNENSFDITIHTLSDVGRRRLLNTLSPKRRQGPSYEKYFYIDINPLPI